MFDRLRVCFFVLKHIQKVVLLTLFFAGSDDLNNFQNLCYMTFFVVYTSSERIYRKTSMFLVLFISFIIFGQYFVSLKWQLFS